MPLVFLVGLGIITGALYSALRDASRMTIKIGG